MHVIGLDNPYRPLPKPDECSRCGDRGPVFYKLAGARYCEHCYREAKK